MGRSDIVIRRAGIALAIMSLACLPACNSSDKPLDPTGSGATGQPSSLTSSSPATPNPSSPATPNPSRPATPNPQVADVWDGSCDNAASGKTYEVGPGKALAALGEVPWTDLKAGDRVTIYARPEAYHEKILVVGKGTKDAPITVCGVPDSSGKRPVIDGADATTRPGMLSYYDATPTRGVITLSAPNDSEWGTKPEYIVISGLEVTGGHPGNKFTDFAGKTVEYPDNAAGIFVERGEWITVRNCLIQGNGNGLFVASGDSVEVLSRHILVDGNTFENNSNVGRDREHNSYIEAEDTVYQFNQYRNTKEGAEGGGLKDRGSGTLIRFNTFQGGARLIDLVEAQESFDLLSKLPAYRQAWVYGNLLEMDNRDGAYAIHYGGDGGDPAFYRKGTLYFYANTVAYRQDESAQAHGSIFDLSTPDEVGEIWDNVFFVSSFTDGATPTSLSLERTSGVHNMGTNAISAAITEWRDPDAIEGGSFTYNADQLTFPADPGFTNAKASDYRPASGSLLINAVGKAPLTVPEAHADVFQLVPGESPVKRAVIGSGADLGAYEAG